MNQVDTFIRTTFRRLELANNILPPDPLILKETLSEKFRPKVKKDVDDAEFMSFFGSFVAKGIVTNHNHYSNLYIPGLVLIAVILCLKYLVKKYFESI
jgi:hypothetical protein